MKNWFEKKSTTNILLFSIVILLGAHLIINVPIIPIAKAQSKTLSKAEPLMVIDSTQFYQANMKTQEYLRSIDNNIRDIKDNTTTVKANMGVIMNCTRNTPTGEKALAVKNIGIQ